MEDRKITKIEDSELEGIWRQRIEDIIIHGNTSSSWNKSILFFPSKWNRKEMILSCLAAIKGIEEDCRCSLVFPKDDNGDIKLKITKKVYEDYQEIVGGKLVTLSKLIDCDERVVLLGVLEVEADELMKRVVIIQKEKKDGEK